MTTTCACDTRHPDDDSTPFQHHERCHVADRPDPAHGYNPSPELAVTYDGVTLTVQRTHLHAEHAIYHWQILTEGCVIPLIDGTMHAGSTMPLRDAAAALAWHWYTTDEARKIMASPIAVWPATTRTPDATVRAALHIIHQEGLT